MFVAGMQSGRSPNVIRSLHIRGSTDHYGEIAVHIDRLDADLSQGRWLACLDSLIVTIVGPTGYEVDIPVSVSATHSYASVCSGRSAPVQAPSRLLLFVLEHARILLPTLVTTKSGSWLEVLQPSNMFHLVFLHAETDKVVRNLKVQALLLLSRVVEQR